RVLSSTGSSVETTLAYSALDQIVRPLSAFLDQVDPEQRHALMTALGGASSTGAGTIQQAPDVMKVGSAVLGLLSSAGRTAPLVVTIDDAHWCDPASLTV